MMTKNDNIWGCVHVTRILLEVGVEVGASPCPCARSCPSPCPVAPGGFIST